jgi:hypothetical protein
MKSAALLTLLASAVPAAAQTRLYGVRSNGDLLHIDPRTGAASAIARSGAPCSALGAFRHSGGRFDPLIEFLITAGPAALGEIRQVDRWSGALRQSVPVSGLPAGYAVRAFAKHDPGDFSLYALLRTPGGAAILATIEQTTGACTVVGDTGRADLHAIAVHPAPTPVVYALGSDSGGTLCILDPSTGAATALLNGGFGDASSLEFLPDTWELLVCGSQLVSINLYTGVRTTIGPTGFADIQDLAIFVDCYANCDPGGPPPSLNIFDFSCFVNRFVSGNPAANCDFSTTPPVLNILDFNCFLNSWTAGCPAP